MTPNPPSPSQSVATATPGVRRYTTSTGETRYLVSFRTPEGRRTTRRGFTTVREARTWREETESAKRRGVYVSPSDSRATVADCWQAYRAAKGARLKASSLRSLDVSWRTHVEPRWGSVQVGRVTHRAVQEWANRLAGERSPTVTIRAVEVLRGALAVAVEDQRVRINAAAGVTLPRRGRSRHRYLSRVEVCEVAQHVPDRYADLFLLLTHLGLRWGEAAALRVEDIDLVRSRIHVHRTAGLVGSAWVEGTPKTHERRTVPVPRFLLDRLVRRTEGKGDADLVFPGPSGFVRPPRKASAQQREEWLQRALREAGLVYLSPHDLRHTAASLAVQSGASVKAVQRMLGHASAAMTLDVYADLFDSDLDDVAARMDEAWAGVGGDSRDSILTP